MYPEAAHRGLSGGKGGGEVPLRFPPLSYGMLHDRYGVLRDFPLRPFPPHPQSSLPRTPAPAPHLRCVAGAVQVSGGWGLDLPEVGTRRFR